MQSISLALTLAQHRTARTQHAATPTPPRQPAGKAAKPSPIVLAIARQARLEPRTMMEMARDRDGSAAPLAAVGPGASPLRRGGEIWSSG